MYTKKFGTLLWVKYFSVKEKLTMRKTYAVAVKHRGRVVGHLPRKFSRVCSLFLRRGGLISCTVTGTRRYSVDLVQGGLEIPCLVTFIGNKELIDKLFHNLK